MLLLSPAVTADNGKYTDATLAQVAIGRDFQWELTSKRGSGFFKLFKESCPAYVQGKAAALVPSF